MSAWPKPVKREKKRKPLRRGKSLGPATFEEAREKMRERARRRRLHPPRKTKHARREREWGRMAYAHTWPCDVHEAFVEEFGLLFSSLALIHPGPCSGRRQYMHLHLEDDGGVRPPDHQGAIGCEGHHKDIDGKVGGKGRWYVTLFADGQLRLKRRLVTRQRARWDALTPEQRAYWNEIGEARFGRRRA